MGSRRPVRELYTNPAPPPTKPQRASSTEFQKQASPSHWRAERPGKAKTNLEKVKKMMERFSCNVFMAEGEQVSVQISASALIKRADQRE